MDGIRNRIRTLGRLSVIVTLVGMLGLLTGCGRILGADPLVQRPVTLEVLRTQVAIAQEYAASQDAGTLPADLPVAVDTLEVVSESLGVRVTHIRVKERLPLTVGDRPGFKISGTYDLALAREGWETSQRRSPFEIYLQRQPEGKTWRLAHLNPGDQDQEAAWELYRL